MIINKNNCLLHRSFINLRSLIKIDKREKNRGNENMRVTVI